MKLPITTVLILMVLTSFAQENFDKYFINRSMRIDYIHAGNNNGENIYLNDIKKQPFWDGSQINMVDTFNFGKFKIEVYDKATNTLIYSRGFNSLFEEWQTTNEAKSISKSFYEVAIIPFPKSPIRFEIHSRDRSLNFSKIFEYNIDPSSYFITNENTLAFNNKKLVDNGDPKNKLDIVFIADGYTKEEMGEFNDDVKNFSDYLTSSKPFNKHKDEINIWLVESVSEESGTDIPGDSIYKNTVINSNFYTFDSERYLTTKDMKALHDAAANVPFDQICIIVNTPIYGGGGIFNYYSIFSNDHEASPLVFNHEFGHGFVGLADEYYTSEVSVEDYYDKKVEPWEPNITTLVDFDSKWKGLLHNKTPIPTPANKKHEDKVGVFEGAAYSAKGIYRPYKECTMKSLSYGFCPVCSKSIEDMLLFYCE